MALIKPLNINPGLPRRVETGWCDEIFNKLVSQKLYKELTLPELRPIYSYFISAYFATDTLVIKEVAGFIPVIILHIKIGNKKIGQRFLSMNGKTEKILEDADKIFKKVDFSAMLAWCRGVLSKPITDTDMTNASQDARRIIKEYEDLGQVLGFCCLVLLRFIIKSEEHITSYFTTHATQVFRRIFPRNEFCLTLRPPNRCMLNILGYVLEFQNGSKPYQLTKSHIFSKVVSLYVDAVSMNSIESREIANVLMYGLLHHTGFNGIGLISLYEQFKRQYCLDDKTAPDYLHRLNIPFQKVSKSFDRISKFSETYANKDHPEYSWKWARIIDGSYFTDYNVKENIILCSHLAAIIESTNPGRQIWNMAGLKNLSHQWRRKLSKWAAEASIFITGADKNEFMNYDNYELDEDEPKGSAEKKKVRRRVQKKKIKGKKTGEKRKGRTTFSKKYDMLEDYYDVDVDVDGDGDISS